MSAFCMMVSIASLVASSPDRPASAGGEAEFKVLRDEYLAKFAPLWKEAAVAWWEANTTGSDAAFEHKTRADKALVELHGDKAMFTSVRAFKDAGTVKDPVLARELDVMYRAFLPGQADMALRNRIVELENEVEKTFNTHRSKVGDKTLSENEVRDALSGSDSAAAEAAWKGYMEVGAKADPLLRELVKLRNQMAKQLGFPNFFAMRLALQEINEGEFFELFDELDTLTREPFARLKGQIDERQSKRFGVPAADLRPWHYGDLFFQEAPQLDDVNLDEVYKSVDLLEVTRSYYASIGLPADDIIARSDLYEKPGKSPHAFSTDLNREGDIRTLCNIKPNLYWADTVLHEIGHAVYDTNIRRDVPFLLREASHSITTEGIAMMLGAMVKTRDYLVRAVKVDAAEADRVAAAAQRALRAEKIIFARWTQVMTRFEHGLYTNPDQDLAKLWWDLKRRYQMLNPPDRADRPDYAAKVHILTAPVYYHSYMMGDLFAAQVRDHIARDVLNKKNVDETCFFGEPKAGAYMKDQIFGPGNLYPWNELTRRATGEPLSAKYFAQQFVN